MIVAELSASEVMSIAVACILGIVYCMRRSAMMSRSRGVSA